MNTISKYITVILIALVLSTGCAQTKQNILTLPENQEKNYFSKAEKYKNGTILLKDNEVYNTTIDQKSSNPDPVDNNVDFGPKEINFGS